MKRVFWNNRGLNDLAKIKFLADIAKEQNLDFIALLETGKKICHQLDLMVYAMGEILCGTRLNLMEGQEAFC